MWSLPTHTRHTAWPRHSIWAAKYDEKYVEFIFMNIKHPPSFGLLLQLRYVISLSTFHPFLTAPSTFLKAINHVYICRANLL